MRRIHRGSAVGAVALLVLAAAVSAVPPVGAGRRGGGPGTAFVLPTPAATPSSSPSGAPAADPSPATASVAASVALAADVEQLSPEASIAELRAASPDLDIDPHAHVRTVSTTAGDPLPPVPGAPSTDDPVTNAAAFVNRHGQGLGLLAGQHAAVAGVYAVPGGDTVVRFQQQVDGVPVLGGDLTVAVNPAGGVVSATAETPPDAPSTTTAQVPAAQAAAKGLATAADRLGVSADQLVVTRTAAWLYDPRVLGAPGRDELRLTWWVTVGAAGRIGALESVLVDATDGTVVLAYSELETAEQRLVCDLANTSGLDIENNFHTYDCGDSPGGPAVARREGQGPVGVTDVNAAYDNLGAVYDFYLSNFGRDSIDGAGLPLRATVRACQFTCPYANAFWDGAQMVFGTGYAIADDVVAHELTHGVTSHTSELVYFAESGGLNEALSDIMGEFIDQSRGVDNDSQWLLGEELPIGAIRSMANPPAFGDPDRVGSAEWNNAIGSPADGYGVHSLSGVVNKAAYLLAAGGTQLGVTVAGIGVPKSAQIWYRLQFLLSSGSEIRDLAALLPAACRSVIGLAGITLADCDQAAKATQATNMTVTGGAFNAKQQLCDTPGMPTQTLFSEDFERGTSRWFLQPYQMTIPSADLPVSWASSGRNSLYTYIPPGQANLAVALRQLVDIPPGTTPYLHVNSNVTTSQGGGTFYVNNSQVLTISGFSKGYNGFFAAIPGLTGTGGPAQLTIQPTTVFGGSGNEWLIDDVSIYLCKAADPGPASYLAGQLSPDKTSVTLNWGLSTYTAPGSDAGWELSFSPAVPGFTNPTVLSGGLQSLVVNGLDPSVRYQVFLVRTVVSDAVHRSTGVMAVLPTDPLFACSIAVDVNGERGRQTCSSEPQRPALPR